MTYRELANQILSMPQEKQNQDVTIYDIGLDEYYPVKGDEVSYTKYTDVLDKGHLFLTIMR